MQIGLKGKQTVIVNNTNTAKTMESGTLDVFATPSMVALMEKTCQFSVAEFLNDNQATVGTAMNIEHTSATPVGLEVTCESELVEIDRRKLVFKVQASDKDGLIGRGDHTRFIIDIDKFLSKADEKKTK